MTETTNTIAIPLHRLVYGTENVRRTGRMASTGELTASILAHGLRQNLNVRAIEGGRYAVVAGGRRLRALKQLAKNRQLPKDHPVPCQVLTDDEDAGEISLAENVCRIAMHPADQFEAFRDLVHGRGHTVEQVAERFGVDTALVEKRLKLAAVHPKLFAAYRKGDLTLDCLMAFTVSDDTEAQLRVWQEGRRGYLSPQNIRRSLTEGAIMASHRLARFVGEEAYVAAGGVVMRDLFDDGNTGFFMDAALLMRQASDKLDALAEQERNAGWKWVKTELENDYGSYYAPMRSISFGDDEEEGDDAEPAVGAFTDDEKGRSGVRIRISHDGTPEIQRGLVHPDDQSRPSSVEKRAKPDPLKGEYPSPVVQDLTAHRTAALRVELAESPALALAAVVHALASPYSTGRSSGRALTSRPRVGDWRRMSARTALPMPGRRRSHVSGRRNCRSAQTI